MYTIINSTANTPATENKEETTMMNTMITFEDDLTTETNISINKIEVTLERYCNLKTTEVERVLRTLASVMAEADRHEKAGDTYFDYFKDRIDAKMRINLMITMIYRAEGNIDKIEKDYCFKEGRTLATELSDHYWAFCK